MATKKKTGANLDEFLNCKVKVKGVLDEEAQGPFIFMGIDRGFVKLEFGGHQFWWNLQEISGFTEWKEETPVEPN